jgi:glycosyl transferase, family 25
MKVDTVYCINLDHRPDRWEQVQIEIAKLGIKCIRVPGVYNKSCPANGLHQSIKNIIANAKKNQLPYVLIIEDDLHILSAEKVFASIENPPENWDLLSGGVYYYVPDKKYSEHWMKVKDYCSMHFVIINNTMYDFILNLPLDGKHIDRTIGNYTRHGLLKVYVMNPMPCKQYPGYSDIANNYVCYKKLVLPWIQI